MKIIIENNVNPSEANSSLGEILSDALQNSLSCLLLFKVPQFCDRETHINILILTEQDELRCIFMMDIESK